MVKKAPRSSENLSPSGCYPYLPFSEESCSFIWDAKPLPHWGPRKEYCRCWQGFRHRIAWSLEESWGGIVWVTKSLQWKPIIPKGSSLCPPRHFGHINMALLGGRERRGVYILKPPVAGILCHPPLLGVDGVGVYWIWPHYGIPGEFKTICPKIVTSQHLLLGQSFWALETSKPRKGLKRCQSIF